MELLTLWLLGVEVTRFAPSDEADVVIGSLASAQAGSLMLSPYDYGADALACSKTKELMHKISFSHGGVASFSSGSVGSTWNQAGTDCSSPLSVSVVMCSTSCGRAVPI